MAIVTKQYLYEQVAELLAGGAPSAGKKFEARMVQAFLQQSINAALKISYIKDTLQQDEVIPDGVVLATYEDVPITGNKIVLPAIPISLRRNMGIFFVGTDVKQFIPLQSGQAVFIKDIGLLNPLTEIGYTPEGGVLVLTSTPTDITRVKIQLAVMDFDKYSDYDLLPLTSDMAGQVVVGTYQLLTQTPPPDKKVDSMVEEVPQKRV